MSDEDHTISILHRWNNVSMHHSMQSLFRYAKENNISMSQVGALFHISHKGTMAVTDISERLGVTSAAASQMLDRLVQQNLLERTEDPNDRRVRQISLTPQGRNLLNESLRIQGLWMRELVQSLSDSECDKISEALNILLEKTNQLASHQESVETS